MPSSSLHNQPPWQSLACFHPYNFIISEGYANHMVCDLSDGLFPLSIVPLEILPGCRLLQQFILFIAD